MEHYDLVVIGSGMGYSIATKVKEADPRKRVLVVDRSSFGGTCPQRGCHPKKIFFETFNALHAANALCKMGLATDLKLDLKSLVQRTADYTDPIDEGSQADFEKRGINYLQEKAEFVDENTLDVGGKKIEADRFVVATGSAPRKLGIPGEVHAITSDDFFRQTDLPDSMLFIGSGYISLEFASMVSVAGTQVTVLETNSRALLKFDSDMVDYLLDALTTRGVRVEFGKEVVRIEKVDGGFRVKVRSGETYHAPLVFNGAGRPPNGNTFGADKAGIALSKDGAIIVDAHMQTSNPRVYAAGDAVAGSPALTPVGGKESEIVTENLIADENISRVNYGHVPSIIFTIPQLFCVGLSEKSIKDDGKEDNYTIIHEELTESLHATSKNLTDLAVKFVVEKATERLAGAHLVGHGVQDLSNLYALAVNNGVVASELWHSSLQVYPTLSYTLNQLLKDV